MSNINPENNLSLSSQLSVDRLQENNEQNKALQQEDFFKLLTTQLQQQDPLKPLDNTDFIAQMAQFSSLESLSEMQSDIRALTQSLTSNQALEASNLVGQSIMVNGNEWLLSEQNALLFGEVDIPPEATSLILTIESAQGELVQQVPLNDSNGLQSITWDGTDSNGDLVSSGLYRFNVTANIGGERESLETHTQTRVDSVSIEPNTRLVSLNGTLGRSFSLDEVISIR